jgi:hypothetical protein
MKTKFQLYHNTFRRFEQWFNLSKNNLSVLCWFVIGLVLASDCRLPKIAKQIPWFTKLPSRVQRLWRWLKSEKILTMEMGKQIAHQWLASWAWETIYLVIDRTDIDNRHWLLFVGLCYRGRTLPLVWQIMPNRGATDFRTQITLLKEVLQLIPQKRNVVLLGDREFRSTSLMNFCKRRGWHFRLRLKCDTWIRANRRWFQLRDLKLKPGEKRFFQTVYITKWRQGPYHLACYFKKGEDSAWYIATDELASGRTVFEYGKRFHTEAMFSDFKKRGFNIENTRIKIKERINRLMVVIVLAYLFLSQLGIRCVRSGRRRFFEKSKRRFYSLFQLGMAYFFHHLNGDKISTYALPNMGSREKLLFCLLRQ